MGRQIWLREKFHFKLILFRNSEVKNLIFLKIIFFKIEMPAFQPVRELRFPKAVVGDIKF